MTIALEAAQFKLLESVGILGTEAVPLENCWRRVLAKPVTAEADFPPFDRSPLDGYALIAAEVEPSSHERPVWLTVTEDIPAGSVPRQMVGPGTAARIMTGAPLPTGATGVVRQENTRRDGARVAVLAGIGAANNICRRGEEITAGQRVIPSGMVINAGIMGMLALLGQNKPLLYRQPRVALLATGSEVRPLDAVLGPGMIRNSNSYMLVAQVQEAGGIPVLFGTVDDDAAAIAARLTLAAECDVIVTTGGVSAGDYDLLPDAYQLLGITMFFNRVSMKPGMPVLAGAKDGKLYIGLSGNPAAASIAFEQLVRPCLSKMGGREEWRRSTARAKLAAPFTKSSGATRFIWVRCWIAACGLLAEPLPFQGNGMLMSVARANALAVIPANSPALPAGTEVEVRLFAEPRGCC